MSFANINTELWEMEQWISSMNNKNNRGPSTDPWGTPDNTGSQLENEPLIMILWNRIIRKYFSHHRRSPLIPKHSSFNNKWECGTESKAFARSRKTQCTEWCLSKQADSYSESNSLISNYQHDFHSTVSLLLKAIHDWASYCVITLLIGTCK